MIGESFYGDICLVRVGFGVGGVCGCLCRIWCGICFFGVESGVEYVWSVYIFLAIFFVCVCVCVWILMWKGLVGQVVDVICF